MFTAAVFFVRVIWDTILMSNVSLRIASVRTLR
jgi:hypothetical protein